MERISSIALPATFNPNSISNEALILRKAVQVLAVLFFGALGAYLLIKLISQSKPHCPSTTQEVQPQREEWEDPNSITTGSQEDKLSQPSQESLAQIESLRTLLRRFPQNDIPDHLVQEAVELLDETSISANGEARLRTLLSQLGIQVVSSPAEIIENRQIRAEQEDAYNTSLAIDAKKDRATAQSEELRAALATATEDLSTRSVALESSMLCFARFKLGVTGLTVQNLESEIRGFETRYNLDLTQDSTPAADRFKDQVEAFNRECTEDFLITQRTQVLEAYQAYTTEIGLVNCKLKWLKMKAKLDELGPEEFLKQVKENSLLDKL